MCVCSKRKFKKFITLSKALNDSVHRMELGKHRWYSSFCDADRHMQGHTTQTKMFFQTKEDNTSRTD